jgi:polysaccharide export outer membrane protein
MMRITIPTSQRPLAALMTCSVLLSSSLYSATIAAPASTHADTHPVKVSADTSQPAAKPGGNSPDNKEQPVPLQGHSQPETVVDDTIPVSFIKGRVSRQAGKYILGPGDSISITVKDLDGYNQNLAIRPDGFTSIHPFGEYAVAGMTVDGLQTWLEDKFRYYLLKPEVTVNLTHMRPAIVYVTGAVEKPGNYQFSRENQMSTNQTIEPVNPPNVLITLTNVLRQSGGLRENADLRNIEIRHVATGEKERFDLLQLLKPESPSDIPVDPWLMPGDMVYVPALDGPMDPQSFDLVSRSTFFKKSFPVMVLGSVPNQGQVQIDPSNNTLNAAIALAGGFKDYSNKTTVMVQRPTTKSSYTKIPVEPQKAQFALEPGDVVYVTDSKIGIARQFLQNVAMATSIYFFAASGTNNIDQFLNKK